MWLIQASIIIFLHVFFSDFYIFLVAFVYTSHMLCFAVFVMPGVHLHISHAVFSVFVMPGVHFAHLICSVWCLRLARLGVKHQLAYYLLVMPGVHFAHLTCCVWCLSCQVYILRVEREDQRVPTFVFRVFPEFVEFRDKLANMFPLVTLPNFSSRWVFSSVHMAQLLLTVSFLLCSHGPTSPHSEFSPLFTCPNFSSRWVFSSVHMAHLLLTANFLFCSHGPTSPHGEFSPLFTWPNFSSRWVFSVVTLPNFSLQWVFSSVHMAQLLHTVSFLFCSHGPTSTYGEFSLWSHGPTSTYGEFSLWSHGPTSTHGEFSLWSQGPSFPHGEFVPMVTWPTVSFLLWYCWWIFSLRYID